MTRKKFDIKINHDTILRKMEENLKSVFHEDGNTYSRIEYKSIINSSGNKVSVPVIQYNIFNEYEDIVHGFSTRIGGVSKEHLSSMNLSFSRGDKRENVLENHRRLGEAIGYNHEKLVFSDQVHDVKIHQVMSEDIGKGITKESDINDTDGLVTNIPGIPLITFYADCVPLYFYDPIKKVVALAHSGWKGTVNKIGSIMVSKMKELYDSQPEDIICAIGPSICKSCYEVSADVADKFKEAFSHDEYEDIIEDKGSEKYLLDLHKACRYNLINAGIKENHIAMPDYCTCCNSSMLFSHRATNGMRGNLAAVIMLKEQ